MLFSLLMLSCLPLFLCILPQKHLGVGLINLEPLRFVTSLGKHCIIELLLHEQIGIFRLQSLDGGSFFSARSSNTFFAALWMRMSLSCA